MNRNTDVMIVGAGPVGLMCAYLADLCGLSTFIADKSNGPTTTGRADALNARTLQYLEIVRLFDDIYPLGKTCNTSSVWQDGRFKIRRSSWWTELEGCFHKHFLMVGQSHVEHLLVRKLAERGVCVNRETTIERLQLSNDGCRTELSTGDIVTSQFVIAADGAHSTVRRQFGIPFEIERPEIVWAVVDGIIDSDFPKVPEIIIFQNETSDVAWIPRENDLDRFYVRMDTDTFSLNEVIHKINTALRPHQVTFKHIQWFSKFAVKEAVAERFSVSERIFLAGDACHIHSVNGGLGLNTGLADAFNLIWKLSSVIRSKAHGSLLSTYEMERKPVAKSVIETSGQLVRSTKYSTSGNHAQNYLSLVEKHAQNITGMGVRYGKEPLIGHRVHDFIIHDGAKITRLYSLLDYTKHTLIIFDDHRMPSDDLPDQVQVLHLSSVPSKLIPWVENSPYSNKTLLIRPDSFIQSAH